MMMTMIVVIIHTNIMTFTIFYHRYHNQIVLDTLNENSLSKEFKLSINFRGDQLLKMPFDVNNPVFLYRMEASASIPPKNSSDAVDTYLNLWQDYDIFSMEELPKSLIVLGGGYIGIEISQIMQAFGV